MVAGECGVPGVTALGPAVEVCSTPSVPVTTLCPRTGASTVRARGSSTAPVTLKPALIPMVRDLYYLCIVLNILMKVYYMQIAPYTADVLRFAKQ